MTVPLICVDAGHGDHDPGARAGGLNEKDIALAHALAVGAAIEHLGYGVIYTRTEDKYLALAARAKAANENGARIFLSMHTNASIHQQVKGAWILYRKQSERARGLATSMAAFMDAVIVPEEPGDAIPLPDQSPHVGYTRLAREVIAAKRPGQSDADALREAGVRSPYRSLDVLFLTRMPALLIEAGFITNPEDRERMTDPYQTELMAAAIAAEVSKAIIQGVYA